MKPQIDKKEQIAEWILKNLNPKQTTSAEQRYDAMELQADGQLCGVDIPWDFNSDHVSWRERTWLWTYILAMNKAKTVLDIGPGDGWPSLLIAPYFEKVVGIDFSKKRVEVQTQNATKLGIKNVEFIYMDACKMSFPDKSFDGVVAASSIEETPDPIKVLKHIFRVLRPGGKLRFAFQPVNNLRLPSQELSVSKLDEVTFKYLLTVWNFSPPKEKVFQIILRPHTQEEKALLKKSCVDYKDEKVNLYGIAFLKKMQHLISDASFFALNHFDQESVCQLVEEIGFRNVLGNPSPKIILDSFIKPLHNKGKLNQIAPYADEICSSVAKLSLRLGVSPKFICDITAEKPKN